MEIEEAARIVGEATPTEFEWAFRVLEDDQGPSLATAAITLILHGRETKTFDSAASAIEYFVLDVANEMAAQGLEPDERVRESKNILCALAGEPAHEEEDD